MVDMHSEAITARLREVSRLLTERGHVRKGVDMSSNAISGRLRTLGALSDMCRRLQAIGEQLKPLGSAPRQR
ncbi:MAG TPA: hypothetical protein VE549_05730 [Myxococcaceae bacterium]|nr:hypothetical protein [Myxococcaceae bacterium]